MNAKIYRVLKGYKELTISDRSELKALIQRIDVAPTQGEQAVLESVVASAGPVDRDTCPCCGK